MVSVDWSAAALKDLDKLDAAIAKRIVTRVLWLEAHFSEIFPEKLTGVLKKLYKLRVGDYRVVYSLHGQSITIEAVGHRRDIYR